MSLYESGTYSLDDLKVLVRENKLNEEDFKFITGYSYNGLKTIEKKEGDACL
jgi:hypothetical protein